MLRDARSLQPAPLDAAGVTSAEIREHYDARYYLGDCGGHRQFAQFGGRKLEDPRLDTVFALAAVRAGMRVLDVGCGRGELSFAFATSGARVTGVDYSADAIALARSTIGDAPVDLVCSDATTFRDDARYDVAVASDVIEHLASAELDRLYANLAHMLQPCGTLVVHTWPNAWTYAYAYPRERATAAARGEDRPENPRTSYERAMHINEQRPHVLRRQLRAAFEHVIVWVGSSEDPRGSLGRRFTVAEMRNAPDVFAVASNAPLSPAQLLERISAHPLALEDVAVTLSAPTGPRRVRPGEAFVAEVTLRNHGAAALASFPPNAVRFAYLWSGDEGPIGGDRGRSRIAPASEPGTERRYAVGVVAPAAAGAYVLRITLVQELVRWFDASVELRVDVVPG